ncbi:MAG: FHA domain-containing protein [Chloroflexi bacterium]|nr:FHA domain-containing protein [Chloroflexota bacterium]
MAFGRLEIFSTDDPVENFILEKETTAIGRSIGNDLVLDRNGVSRYHVAIVSKDQQTTIEDLESVNGTYIDGVRVNPHEPRVLRGGEEIQIGDLRVVFHPSTDFDTTIANRAVTTQQIEAEGFRLELEGPYIAVAPGAHGPATLRIINTSARPEHFSIQVEGIPKEWVRLDRSELDLPAGESIEIGASFRPLRRSDTAPGEYKVIFKVRTPAHPERPTEVATKLQILQYNGFGAALGNPLVESQQSFQLYVHNQGNGSLALNFYSHTPALQIDIKPPHITLKAGERQTIAGEIRPKRPHWFGKPRHHKYVVISRSLDAAGFQVPLEGVYHEKPALPPWAPFIGLAGFFLAAAVILGIVLIVLASGDNDKSNGNSSGQAAPVVQSFNVASSEVIWNEPFRVTWLTENTSDVTLTVEHGGVVVAEYPQLDPSGETSIVLEEAGRYNLTLIAEKGDQSVRQPTSVVVRPALTLSIVYPSGQTELYRNVEQQITLNWSVAWTNNPTTADPSRLPPQVILNSGPLGYENTNVAAIGTNQVITVRPESADAIVISLQSIGPDDIQAQNEERITVVYPACTLQLPATDVFGGPAKQGYPLLLSLAPNVVVEVDARNSGGDWLRIRLDGQNFIQQPFGWIQSQGTACDFPMDALLVTTDYAPPATSTTPIATPRPNITPSVNPQTPAGDAQGANG